MKYFYDLSCTLFSVLFLCFKILVLTHCIAFITPNMSQLVFFKMLKESGGGVTVFCPTVVKGDVGRFLYF